MDDTAIRMIVYEIVNKVSDEIRKELEETKARLEELENPSQ